MDFSYRSLISMAIYLRDGMSGIGAYNAGLKERVIASPQIVALRNYFMGKQIIPKGQKNGLNGFNPKGQSSFFTHAHKSYNIWEEKINMEEIYSAQDFVDTLRNAGDKLVVVEFHSTKCEPCNTLYPKICQLLEDYPDAMLLRVDYEEFELLCNLLRVPVLPFFRFYRGTKGRVCWFSCTAATIGKFKHALAKHGADPTSLGSAKGLNDSELQELALHKLIEFSYPRKSPTN